MQANTAEVAVKKAPRKRLPLGCRKVSRLLKANQITEAFDIIRKDISDLPLIEPLKDDTVITQESIAQDILSYEDRTPIFWEHFENLYQDVLENSPFDASS